MYTINDKAYRFESIENVSSLFNNEVINATYIIHLENNGRYENILEQIKQFKTTNKIYILHNKGFKSGLKQKYIDKPPLDLVDAFLTCLKHAANNNYKNVLIFEDDFICHEKLLDKSITNDITNFIKSKTKKNEKFCYHLGVLPFVTSNTFENHRKLFAGIGTHAVIYSDKFIKYSLSYKQEDIDDWDYFKLLSLENKTYMYDKCLCYQPFPETENSKFWGSNGNFLTYIYFQSLHTSFKLFKFDTNPKFGFNKAYEMCIKIPTLSL
uniref:Glycosyltransferase n=1 Tax=viral metagenome TaxID=1070528 RepID=A0A6C0KS57_9ZZZZ